MNELFGLQVPLSTCFIYVGTWLQAATRPESTGFKVLIMTVDWLLNGNNN